MTQGVTSSTKPKSHIFIGLFFCLLAAVCTVLPIGLFYRSLAILGSSYLAFSFGGIAFAYLSALFMPLIGIIADSPTWFTLSPTILSANLLAILGLDYGWRFGALILSPLLYAIPVLLVSRVAQHPLFNLDLPWQPNATVWLAAHVAVALLGTVVALLLNYSKKAV